MKKDFLKDFESMIIPSKPGFPTWFDALSEDARECLGQIKAKYAAGGYAGTKKKALVRAVIAIAKDRGWPITGEQGVQRWLDRAI